MTAQPVATGGEQRGEDGVQAGDADCLAGLDGAGSTPQEGAPASREATAVLRRFQQTGQLTPGPFPLRGCQLDQGGLVLVW